MYASTADDVRVLFGKHTYAHCSKAYRGASDNFSALDTLIRATGGVRISAHIPAPAANDQGLLISKNPAMRNAVAPIWDGVTILDDQITRAGTGEIVITAVMLMAVKILRADAFARKEVQLAA